MRILLVADNRIEATRLTAWLCTGLGADCHVHHLDTLQEGLRYLREYPRTVDVLIVDLIIPQNPEQINGLTIAQEHAPMMAIIVVSELDSDDVVRTAIRAGAQEFLVKSGLTAERLATIINNVVMQRQRWYEGLQRIQQAPTMIQQAVVLCELSTVAVELLARLARERGLSTQDTLEQIIHTTIAQNDAASQAIDQLPPSDH